MEISRSTAVVPFGVGRIGLTEGLDDIGDTMLGEDRVEPDMWIGVILAVIMTVVRVRFFGSAGLGIHGQRSEVVDELLLEPIGHRDDPAGGF